MATAIELPIAPSLDDNDSDYGSDFSPEEELIVQGLLADIEDNLIVSGIERNDADTILHIPHIPGREERTPPSSQRARIEENEISYSVQSGEQSTLSKTRSPPETTQDAPSEPATAKSRAEDTRSPLERFRTFPKKAFSVTDLASPAWCELQYWYTLTKFGKKRATPAMKRGTKIHQKLEEEVHTTVRVDVETKEDRWGLRIWNVIQGLRTLRETGLTRELEIWGTVDGHVVNGVIDELSYTCPDPGLEKALPKHKPLPSQKSIAEFFQKNPGTSITDFFRSPGNLSQVFRPNATPTAQKIYLCDVKTRGVKTLPTATAFKPTQIQLMLYHHLLSALATNSVDFSVLTARYTLDPERIFSDSFIVQIGTLNDNFLDASSEPTSSPDSELHWSQDTMNTLLEHNNLSLLWSLMIEEFQLTLPEGMNSLGRLLKAEYRSRGDGEVLGVKTFVMDDGELDRFIQKEMQWWRGERSAEGVVVEEAYKCHSCEFAEECDWRKEKEKEATGNYRRTKKSGGC